MVNWFRSLTEYLGWLVSMYVLPVLRCELLDRSCFNYGLMFVGSIVVINLRLFLGTSVARYPLIARLFPGMTVDWVGPLVGKSSGRHSCFLFRKSFVPLF